MRIRGNLRYAIVGADLAPISRAFRSSPDIWRRSREVASDRSRACHVERLSSATTTAGGAASAISYGLDLGNIHHDGISAQHLRRPHSFLRAASEPFQDRQVLKRHHEVQKGQRRAAHDRQVAVALACGTRLCGRI